MTGKWCFIPQFHICLCVLNKPGHVCKHCCEHKEKFHQRPKQSWLFWCWENSRESKIQIETFMSVSSVNIFQWPWKFSSDLQKLCLESMVKPSALGFGGAALKNHVPIIVACVYISSGTKVKSALRQHPQQPKPPWQPPQSKCGAALPNLVWKRN